MMKNSSSFFANKDCEYYPCHKVENEEEFNCLFCYCPLYALGDKCGGNLSFTESGIKDCSNCNIPHRPDAVIYMADKLKEIVQIS